MARNYYEALGLPRWATEATVEATYRKEMELMQSVRAQQEKLSPVESAHARTALDEHWKELTEAYDVLSNPRKREQYDKFLNRFQRAPSTLERRLGSERRHLKLRIKELFQFAGIVMMVIALPPRSVLSKGHFHLTLFLVGLITFLLAFGPWGGKLEE